MSIVQMVSKEEFEAHPNDPDYWTRPSSPIEGGDGTPLYLHRTHKGLVIRTGEHNYHDDSDFYAVVWDPVKKETKEIEYATTRGWTYPNHAEPDATPEVQAEFRTYEENVRRIAREAEKAKQDHMPAKGKVVKVVSGVKIPVGTQGEVVWEGEGKFGNRVGFKGPDGKVVFTDEKNVRVVMEPHDPSVCYYCREGTVPLTSSEMRMARRYMGR